MRFHLHVVVVALQVVVFQLVVARRARALSDFTFGVKDLPEPAATRLRAMERSAETTNRILGAALLIAAALIAYALPFDPGGKKLGVSLVSLASSAILVGNLLFSRRVTKEILNMLPETGVRVATLERRSLKRYYPLAWESVGPVLFAATLAMTIWALVRVPGALAELADHGVRLWMPPVFQAFFLALVLLVAVRLVQGHHYVPHNTAVFAGNPEEGLMLEDRLRTLKLRALLALKILVTLQLGLIQLKRIQMLADGRAAGWLSPATWLTVVLLMIVFAVFVVQVSRARRSPPIRGSV